MKLPPAIWKAHSDNPFQYALGLRDGTIIFFEGCTVFDKTGKRMEDPVLVSNDPPAPPEIWAPDDMIGDWIAVDGVQYVGREFPDWTVPFGARITSGPNWDRGMDVRGADIVWACDAPFGS